MVLYIVANELNSGPFLFGLWDSTGNHAGCLDELERIVRIHAQYGAWPELWVAIKNTLYFDDKNGEPEVRSRLEALKGLAAPHDLFSEIEAYACINASDHAEAKGRDREDTIKSIYEKVESLGKQASTQPELLERLGAKLWVKQSSSLLTFGRGLALGSTNKLATFETLLGLIHQLPADEMDLGLLFGFLNEVHRDDPHMSRVMHEQILQDSKLKKHVVYLLNSIRIDKWAAEKLIELATEGELEAWRFEQISYGRAHETIDDEQLAGLLVALLGLENGVSTVFQILEMRFFIDKDSKYVPSEPLLSAGRKAIYRLISPNKNGTPSYKNYGFERIAQFCLAPTTPEKDISEIVNQLCEGVEHSQTNDHEFKELVSNLVENFPEIVFERVFVGGDRESQLVRMLFRDRLNDSGKPSINQAPLERMLDWCDTDQSRIQRMARAVRAFVPHAKSDSQIESAGRLSLSPHTLALLDAADDKHSIVESIYAQVFPSVWMGSRADILEAKSTALSRLLQYPSDSVKELVDSKLKELAISIQSNREQESKWKAQREQRFE